MVQDTKWRTESEKRIKITYFNGSERMEKLRKACGGVILYFAFGVI